MSVQQNLIAGVCVAIGIASVGISLKAGIDHFVDRDRVVTVKGLAERNVQADYVIWPVTFRVTGNDLSALYEKAQTQSEEIRNFLISQGIKAQVALSLPSAEEQLVSDVVLVLDKSTSTGLKEQALEMLQNLKKEVQEKGAKVKVGVVLFNKEAHTDGFMDLETQYEAIEAAICQEIKSGKKAD